MQLSISRYSSVWLAGKPRLREDPLMQAFGSKIMEIRLHATSKVEDKAIRDMAHSLKKSVGGVAKVETPDGGHFSNLVLFCIED